MKIGIIGLNLEEGKVKYKDEILLELQEKFNPKKFTPYFVEFVKGDDLTKCDAFAVNRENILDLLILDMEKLETRLERSEDAMEKELLPRCLSALEDEIPLCDFEFKPEELDLITNLAPLSYKGTLQLDNADCDPNEVIAKAMDKAGVMFFYTAGKQEVRSWFVDKDSDIVTCAGKIHSDLARGFIKGDVVNIKDFGEAHNLRDAQSKGLAKLVDRDYIVQSGDIIEIRFNV